MHVEYPPGYPLFLAIAGVFTHQNIDWFLALNVAALVATLWLVARVVAARWSWWAALAVLLLLALNPYLVDSGGQLASEPLFIFCTVASVTLLAGDDPGPARRVAAGGLAIFAAMTRSVGIALIIAIGIQWLLERRWKDVALFGAASLVTVGAWLAWTVHSAARVMGESYVGDAVVAFAASRSGVVGTMIGRLGMHFADFSAATLPLVLAAPSIPGTLVDNIVSAAVVGIGVAAGIVVLWRRWRAAALYLLASIAVLFAWPFMLTRFVIPLIPLLAAAFILGLVALLRPPRALWRWGVVAALVLTLFGTGIARSAPLVARRAGCVRGSPPAGCELPDKASVYAAARWIHHHLPADAVVVYAKPETLSWYSEVRTLPVRLALAGDSTVVSEARAAGAQYLLLSSVQAIETSVLQYRLAADCGFLELLESFPPRTYLFRLLTSPAADSSGCRAVAEYQRLNRGRNFDAGR